MGFWTSHLNSVKLELKLLPVGLLEGLDEKARVRCPARRLGSNTTALEGTPLRAHPQGVPSKTSALRLSLPSISFLVPPPGSLPPPEWRQCPPGGQLPGSEGDQHSHAPSLAKITASSQVYVQCQCSCQLHYTILDRGRDEGGVLPFHRLPR